MRTLFRVLLCMVTILLEFWWELYTCNKVKLLFMEDENAQTFYSTETSFSASFPPTLFSLLPTFPHNPSPPKFLSFSATAKVDGLQHARKLREL